MKEHELRAAATCANCGEKIGTGNHPPPSRMDPPVGLIPKKYHISKGDGSPVDSDLIYFVLSLNSRDQAEASACRMAARTYASEIRTVNPKLADDLERLCDRIIKDSEGDP